MEWMEWSANARAADLLFLARMKSNHPLPPPSSASPIPPPPPAPNHQAPGTSNQAPGTSNQAPRTKHEAPVSSSHGKIACLPKSIREELNCRLDNGERGPQILAWLNALPEVRTVLAEPRFGGLPINEQNLSNWRQGGFVRWQHHQQELELVHLLTDEAGDFDRASGGQPLTGLLSAQITLALSRLLLSARNEPDPAVQQQTILSVAREAARLHRSDQDARRLRLAFEDQTAARKKEREQALAVLAEDEFTEGEREQLKINAEIANKLLKAEVVGIDLVERKKPLPPDLANFLAHRETFGPMVKQWEAYARREAWSRTMERCQVDAEIRADFEAGALAGKMPDPEIEQYLGLPERERHRWLRRRDDDPVDDQPDEDETDDALSPPTPDQPDSSKIKVTQASAAAPVPPPALSPP